MKNSMTTKALYENLIQMPDLHSIPEFDGEKIIWKLYKNAEIHAWCDGWDTCIDIISNSIFVGSLTHWHPEEDKILDELYSLGKKGNIFVLRKSLLFSEVFYLGEYDKYRFDKNKKWYWGRLIYLEQK